jgi:predicted PurR-regulated permease PerM
MNAVAANGPLRVADAAAAPVADDVDPPLPPPPVAPAPRSSAAVVILAALAVTAALWSGSRFLIPLAAGLILAMLVEPAVTRLQGLVSQRALASALVLAGVATLGVALLAASSSQLLRMSERLPDAIQRAAIDLGSGSSTAEGTVRRAREALRELDLALNRRAAGAAPARRAPPRAAAAASASELSDNAAAVLTETAVAGSWRLLRFVVDLTILGFIAFFVLAGGRTLERRFVDLWPTVDGRRRAAVALAECARQMRRYAAVVLVANVMVGAAVWLWFRLAGVHDPLSWGIAAALLHVVPYLGMALFTALGSAEVYLTYGSVATAATTAAGVVALSTLIGTGVSAWLQGRAARMNAAAVFIGVVFWGGLWGAWGLFLGPALVVVLKVAAEHNPSTQRWARLLSD